MGRGLWSVNGYTRTVLRAPYGPTVPKKRTAVYGSQPVLDSFFSLKSSEKKLNNAWSDDRSSARLFNLPRGAC